MFRYGVTVLAMVTLGFGASSAAAGGPPAPGAGLVVAWTREADREPGRLTRHPAFDFARAFSPDSTRIAFVSTRDGNEEIYVMNADGSGQSRLTTHPAWDFNLGPIERYAVSLDGSRRVSRVADGSATGVPGGLAGTE